MKKWIVIIVLIVVAGAAGVYYWQTAQTVQTGETDLTQTIAVQRASITAGISPTGEIYASQYTSLTFNVSLIPISKINVEAGQVVEKGKVLATLDTDSLERAVDQAEADLLTAQGNLEEALEKYSELDQQKAQLAVAQAEVSLEQSQKSKEDLFNPDLEAAKKAVREAEYNLEVAQVNLELTELNTSVTKSIRDLEYTVAWHERNVRDIQSQARSGGGSATQASAEVLAQVSRPSGPGSTQEPMTLEEALEALAEAQNALELARLNASLTLANAQDKVIQAENALLDAREELAELQAEPDALAMAKADNAITQAEYRLAKAGDDLDTILAGADAKSVQLAQARYDSAEAKLAEAQVALDKAVMVAPFGGTIISVKAEVGDEISSTDVIITMADLNELRVRAFIDETEITQVELGQEVKITFDAFPGYTFEGRILEVPLQGELSQNVVIYEVTISLEGADAVTLKPGMTANLSIETARKENALLLPMYAVMWSTEGTVVTVQDAPDGTPMLIPVQTGITDGIYIEIVRGLNEGDSVVVQYTEQQEQLAPGMGGGMGGTGGGK